jgi:hypothetical protein
MDSPPATLRPVFRESVVCLDRLELHTISAHVRSASGRLPVFVGTAVATVQIAVGIVAQSVIEALPCIWTTSRALR